MHCATGIENLCLDDIDGAWWGIGVELVLLVYAFVGVAIVADSHLVPSLETLCVRWGVPEDVAGASFMAFGSAAPEITINAISTLKAVLSSTHADHGGGGGGGDSAGDDAALGVGAIFGSGMIAFTAIPGFCGIFAGSTLQLKRRPLARDLGAYLLSLLWLCWSFRDSRISWDESSAMVCAYAAYMLVVVLAAPVRQAWRTHVLKKPLLAQKQSFVLKASPKPEGAGAGAGAGAAAGGSYVPPTAAGASGERGAAAAPATAEEGDEEAGLMATAQVMLGQVMRRVQQEQQKVVRFIEEPKAAAAAAAAAPPPADEEDEAEEAEAPAWLRTAFAPLDWLIGVTCPPCAHDTPDARWYPVTLAVATLWVAFLSLLISAIVSRFGALLGIPQAFLGMYIVAIGAEIPDTIQSVTVARRGYGSMAVSNSCGSQIINILIGLGLPWAITNATGSDIVLKGHADLQLMALFLGGCCLVFAALLVFATAHTWRPGDHRKAQLGPAKGKALLCTYALCVAGYPAARLAWGGDTPLGTPA